MIKKRLAIVGLAVMLLAGLAGAADEKPPAAPAAPAAAAAPAAPAAASTLSDAAKISYSLGVQFGNSLKRAGGDVDRTVFFQGFQDAMDGKPLQVTDEEMKKCMTEFQKAAMAKRQEEQKKQLETNVAEQKTFMEENGKKEGVVTLPSGLQYKVLQDGAGATPTANDKVKVNYKGTFVNGEEFDSSYKRNAPAEFQVTKVVAGWTEALKLMKVGAKWQLVVPAELGYGAQGRPGIGPNKMLIFEIELLEVTPGEPSVTIAPSPAPGAPPTPPAAPPAEAPKK